MPNLAALHPQVVHFAVALVVVGVLFRGVSLIRGVSWLSPGSVSWLSPAAAALVALGAFASVVAVRSGIDAHGPVERVPGARPAVVAHEEWGERARNAVLLLLVVEAVATALLLRNNPRARGVQMAAAAVGLVAVGVLARAGDLGGELVYGYAGGVGIRSGDPVDVNRALIAAAHHQANLDRQAGRPLEAAALMNLVADRFPDQLELQVARAEALLSDQKDAAASLARLDTIQVPTDDTRLRVRVGIARASALAAAGELSAARQVLETLRSEFPTNAQVQRRLAELQVQP